jgi:hypothetical protein
MPPVVLLLCLALSLPAPAGAQHHEEFVRVTVGPDALAAGMVGD